MAPNVSSYTYRGPYPYREQTPKFPYPFSVDGAKTCDSFSKTAVYEPNVLGKMEHVICTTAEQFTSIQDIAFRIGLLWQGGSREIRKDLPYRPTVIEIDNHEGKMSYASYAYFTNENSPLEVIEFTTAEEWIRKHRDGYVPYPIPNFNKYPTKKNFMSSTFKKIKNLFQTEPEKTFTKVGFIDECGEITETGKNALWYVLLEANKEALKILADKILEEEKKETK